jgi:adenosylcobyric acid synthase
VSGGLLVAGTTSDAGKSVVTAGICRWLARQGVKVAPFKAQNMSNNSAIAIRIDGTGGEIGRAQALQALACGLDPDVRFNPVLLKPGSDLSSQVVLLGEAVDTITSANFRSLKPRLAQTAYATLAALREEFDVVVCEGAGSPAEINLRDADFVNMGLAREADLPVVVVGDIDRGGVFASFYGTLALLDAHDQALVSGFIVNKFRGSLDLLRPGLSTLEELTGRPVVGTLPFDLDLWLDAEDSLAYGRVLGRPAAPRGSQWLRVAVIRLPRVSNATDAEALALEPGVSVRFTVEPAEIEAADLVVLPGSKSTVADLAWLRKTGLDRAVREHVAKGRPVLGICGGYQMLAKTIRDDVESGAGEVAGLGLLDVDVVFEREKVLGRPVGEALGVPVGGYEIHHGRVVRIGELSPFVGADGVTDGTVFGTHWHGAFESDGFRREFLKLAGWLAGRDGFVPADDVEFGAARQATVDRLGDLVEAHLDTDLLWRLIENGAPKGMPLLAPGARL